MSMKAAVFSKPWNGARPDFQCLEKITAGAVGRPAGE
jgi:hypothetical protein